MKVWWIKSGIQRKYLRYTLALLLLALLLSSVGVWIFLYGSLTEAVSGKYEFMAEKMGISLDNLLRRSEEVTAECIVNEDVQKSLRAVPLEEVEKNALSKYFAYLDLEHIAEYCYVDNKQNVYTRSYSKISYADFRKSKMEEQMGSSYAKTQWFWAEDTLFGTGKPAFFIARYVHSMDYAHEPGMLFLKMDEGFFGDIPEHERGLTEQIAVGIVDAGGKLWISWGSKEVKALETVWQEACQTENLSGQQEETKISPVSGMIMESVRVRDGVLSAYRQADSGLTLFILVPDSVLTAGLTSILLVMVMIYLLVMVIAVAISIYFSRRFTRPIQDISRAMAGFDGKDFHRTIELNTNTELDQIGQSYNEMLGNIRQLLEAVKSQQKELRTSELNTLISQINPHFLYNTLDTIYMLARINKEETTMKMIQALSKYLRLSLSKGNDMVTVEDELENVKSYMEIQQIRNQNLFQYTIDCQVSPQQTWVLKLILQPLVENAIKYGFCEIYEGGQIRIAVREEEGCLVFTVENSGLPIRQEMAEKINGLNGKPFTELKACFPEKKNGYGVMNVITRLRLKYGEDVYFGYEAEEKGTRCILRIPHDGRENMDL